MNSRKTLMALVAIVQASFVAELVEAQDPKPKLVILRKKQDPAGVVGMRAMAVTATANQVKAGVDAIVKKHGGQPVTQGNVAAAAAGALDPNAANVAAAVAAAANQPPSLPTYVFEDPARAASAQADLEAQNFEVGFDRIVRIPDDTTPRPGMAAAFSALSTEDASWNIQRVGAKAWWDRRLEGDGVTVAVVDSGVSPHSAFGTRLKSGVAFLSDVNGNAQQSSANVTDTLGHGTAVAAIVAGDAFTNSRGRFRVGIAPKASIVPIKVLGIIGGNPKSGYESDIIRGIRHVVDNDLGVKVVNMSFGFDPGFPSAHEDGWKLLIQDAERKGILLVAAAGNHAPSGPTIPATLANILTVGATDEADKLARFSVQGGAVPHLSAPGVGVPSALSKNHSSAGRAENELSDQQGTSFAAPHVSGAAALILSTGKTTTPAQLRSDLMGLVDRATSGNGRGAGVLFLGGNGPPPPPATETSVEERLRKRIEDWEKKDPVRFKPVEPVNK
jgi:subtilisin family serine protease